MLGVIEKILGVFSVTARTPSFKKLAVSGPAIYRTKRAITKCGWLSQAISAYS